MSESNKVDPSDLQAGGINCLQSSELLSQSRDEPLSAEQMAQLQTHVTHCPHCRHASQQFAQMFTLLEAMLHTKSTPD
ncbi:zf-HC2 domain-containing protein [Chitinimonas sp. PSY-7]